MATENLIQTDDELSNQIESEHDQPLSMLVHVGVQPNDESAEIEANDHSVLVRLMITGLMN
jgi:hypothetical protein